MVSKIKSGNLPPVDSSEFTAWFDQAFGACLEEKVTTTNKDLHEMMKTETIQDPISEVPNTDQYVNMIENSNHNSENNNDEIEEIGTENNPIDNIQDTEGQILNEQLTDANLALLRSILESGNEEELPELLTDYKRF